jgi:hypothetical protein
MNSQFASSAVTLSTMAAIDEPPGCVASAAVTAKFSVRVTAVPLVSLSGTESDAAVSVVRPASLHVQPLAQSRPP